jgi:lipopolysaccharide transport system ATP-binding protein
MTPIIEIESVSKKYNISRNVALYRTLRESLTSFVSLKNRIEFWALRDITFNMEPGETMGIIGENGAGKTTLLKILSKITKPTSGRGIIHGRVASLLEVGTGFHPELTGRENIYLNGVILGLKKKEIDRNFERIVEFAGVRNYLNTPVKHYSTGMWARLAFSVAAHLEPEILLIDEVLSVGDAEFQKKSLSKMNELSKDGRTVVQQMHVY